MEFHQFFLSPSCRILLIVIVAITSIIVAIFINEHPENRNFISSVGTPTSGSGNVSNKSLLWTPVAVKIPSGKILGRSSSGIDSFLGIPYADPPVGLLRLRPPRKLSKPLGFWPFYFWANKAPSCPQMFISSDSHNPLYRMIEDILLLSGLKSITGQEDCLNISVQRPKGTKKDDKLPVLFWIFGGGFQLGSTATYNGRQFLEAGVQNKQPFILVLVNYRVSGFGFLPGSEILKDGSSNIGLLDQRMGLEWVADNIAHFGGDPDKVVLWGESAGAISAYDQMRLYGGNASYNGKPLFRGAILSSGSVAPATHVNSTKAQAVYDKVVQTSGCAGVSDTLACLRQLPYKKFFKAVNSIPSIFSYNSLALPYLPRPDGHVLPDSVEALTEQGRYYPVPMIIGNQEDEGTLFSYFLKDLSTTENLVQWMSQRMFTNATRTRLTQLIDTYGTDLSSGSPFRTGDSNEFFKGFKRNAAILGDLVFILVRRMELFESVKVNPQTPIWSYLASYYYGFPFLGTFHGSELLPAFYSKWNTPPIKSSRAYMLNFLYNLDPNNGTTENLKWPKWAEDHQLMWLHKSHNELLKDDFRNSSYHCIIADKASLRV